MPRSMRAPLPSPARRADAYRVRDLPAIAACLLLAACQPSLRLPPGAEIQAPPPASRSLPEPEPRVELRPLFRESWALVIGIDRYRHLPPLQAAVQDAHRVAEALGDVGFATERVIVLTDHRATRADILGVLEEELPVVLGPDDRLVVYFAGHGHREPHPTAPRGWIMPSDGHPGRLHASAIAMDDLGRMLEGLAPGQSILIVDSSYSGFALAPSPERRGADGATAGDGSGDHVIDALNDWVTDRPEGDP